MGVLLTRNGNTLVDFNAFLQYADRGGFILALIVFIAALYFRKLRWGKDFDDLKSEGDECERALRAVNDKALAKLERMEQLSELAREKAR